MFFYSRVLPATGAIPKPGQDISGAIWQQHMRSREIALFCFDAKSGDLLTAKGDLPQIPVREHCMIFGSRYSARLTARDQVTSKPWMLCALYDQQGRWLITISRQGETRRSPGLAVAWILLQFPLMALYGCAALIAGSSLFGIPLRWRQMSPQDLKSLIAAGLLLGVFGRLIFEVVRRGLVVWHAQPALAEMGSPAREKLYQRLAKNSGTALLVPRDITFTPAAGNWPSPEKYLEWTTILRNRGFQQFGAQFVPEVKGSSISGSTQRTISLPWWLAFPLGACG